MTDTSQLLPNQTAVTSDCMFNLKPSAVRARSYRASIPSSNKSTFNPSDVAIFYIPAGRRNTYLDPTQSYMRYTVKNNETGGSAIALNFDQDGSSVINRLDVFHASNLLESVQQYNVIHSYLMDFNLSQSQKAGLSGMYGCDSAGDRDGIPIAAGNYNTVASGTAVYANCNSQFTVCIPVLSGVFGLGSEKCLPLGMLSDDIRVEITLENQLNGMAASAATTVNWTITSFELELAIIELSDEGESMVRSIASPERPIFLHGTSFRHYVSSLAANTSGSVSFLVPARFASVKSLILCPRSSLVTGVSNAYSISGRVNPNFASYWWRIGSALIPSKPVILENANSTGGYAEALAEIQKSFHSLDSNANSCAVPFNYFNRADSLRPGGSAGDKFPVYLGDATYYGAFAIAQECESFAQRSDLLISGLNTLSTQVFFEANISSVAPTHGYTLDFYAWYDHIMVLEDGILSVRF